MQAYKTQATSMTKTHRNPRPTNNANQPRLDGQHLISVCQVTVLAVGMFVGFPSSQIKQKESTPSLLRGANCQQF